MVVSAALAPTTDWKLYRSARSWPCESLDILKKHYTSTQEEVLVQLKGMDLEEGERALEVGVRWARRNLKKHPGELHKSCCGRNQKTVGL